MTASAQRPAPTGQRAEPEEGRAGADTLLELSDLSVSFETSRGLVRAVQGVSLALAARTTLGIVGESGSGKSALARAVMRLHPTDGSALQGGRIRFAGRDLSALDEAGMCAVRGREIGMIFQDPMSSLNPVKRIGRQIGEVLQRHLGLSARAARGRAKELIEAVGLSVPEQRLDQYPMHLSGGMRQRVAIAIALAAEPKLLIADEPTTALDVTVQAQILDLLDRLREERGMSVLLITHNLGIVAGYCDEVAVMYAGRIVERGRTQTVLARPHMPYTAALIGSVPNLADPPHTRLTAIQGAPPNPIDLPAGCSFRPRCGYARPDCGMDPPPLVPAGAGGDAYACLHPLNAT